MMRARSLPPPWRGLGRRFPRTLRTFQVVLLTGFLSLVILRNNMLGVGNVSVQRPHDAPELELDDRYLHRQNAIDIDIEPKRNLAQVKNVERVRKEIEQATATVDKEKKTTTQQVASIEPRQRKKAEQVANVDKARKETERVDKGDEKIEQVAEKRIDHDVEEAREEDDQQSKELMIKPAVITLLHEVDPSIPRTEAIGDETAAGVDRAELKGKPDAKIVELQKAEEVKVIDENVQQAVEEANATASEEPKEPEKTPEQIFQELHRQAIENMTRITSRNDPFSLGPKISDWDEQRASWLDKNPHLKSTDPHKPKILLITGSQPWPCKSPVGDHYLLKMLKNKVDYARVQNLEIFYNFAHLDKPMSHFWAKLPLIRKMMLTRPEMEWIFWMDSDAMFTDMVFEIPFERYIDYNIVMWGYDSGIYKDRSWVACNTGVFFLRNNQWTLDLLDEWVLMGSAGEIRNEAGKILSTYLTGRPVMMADDQSALVFLMLTREELRPKIHLEWDYWLSGYWADIVDRYEEFSNKSKPGAGGSDWPFTTHFTGCQPCSGANNPMYEGTSCLDGMERAFNFADNQVLRAMGFEHESLTSSTVRRIRNETSRPLGSIPTHNTWAVDSFY